MFSIRQLKVIASILFLCLIVSTWWLVSVTREHVRINRSIAASEATIAKLRLQLEEFFEPKPSSLPQLKQTGTFVVTAYCSCSICCGKYGIHRPIVKGRSAVVTASGNFANEGITIAADPKVLPIGSHVFIEGIGLRTVQDVGGSIRGKRIDVYFNSHAKAVQFGKRKLNVWRVDFKL